MVLNYFINYYRSRILLTHFYRGINKSSQKIVIMLLYILSQYNIEESLACLTESTKTCYLSNTHDTDFTAESSFFIKCNSDIILIALQSIFLCYFLSDSIQSHSTHIPRLYHYWTSARICEGAFESRLLTKETEQKLRGCRSFSKTARSAKVVVFVRRRVLHLYGVRESFVERLMCSAKRRNKIKTERRAPEYEGDEGRGRPRDKSGNKSDRGL